MSFKKLGWRFVRGGVYAFLSVKVAFLGAQVGLDESTSAAIVTGIMLALDKLLGVGGLVSETK